MKLRNKKGFTIVELVIVIGVIGILSAILIPTFINVTDNAKKSAMKSNCANAYSAYVAEAADGVIDEGTYAGYAIKHLKQEEVNLAKGGKNYSFVNGEWTEQALSGASAYVVTKDNNGAAIAANLAAELSTFNGYVVTFVNA